MDAVADDMGIRSRMNYDYSPQGAECMFELERTSKRRFFDRLASHGRSFLMDEQYDYFESKEEPEKEPDITWNIEDNNKTSSTNDDNQINVNQTTENHKEQEDSKTEKENVENEEPIGFWNKIKNVFKD